MTYKEYIEEVLRQSSESGYALSSDALETIYKDMFGESADMDVFNELKDVLVNEVFGAGMEGNEFFKGGFDTGQMKDDADMSFDHVVNRLGLDQNEVFQQYVMDETPVNGEGPTDIPVDETTELLNRPENLFEPGVEIPKQDSGEVENALYERGQILTPRNTIDDATDPDPDAETISTIEEEAEMLIKLREQTLISSLLSTQKGAIGGDLALEESQQKYGISGGLALAQDAQRKAQLSYEQAPLRGELAMLPYEKELLTKELTSAKSSEERANLVQDYDLQKSEIELQMMIKDYETYYGN